jgi:hypothetical protein
MSMENWWNDNDRRRPKHLKKKPVSVTFFTTNPTQTVLGTNTVICSKVSAANHLSNGSPHING